MKYRKKPVVIEAHQYPFAENVPDDFKQAVKILDPYGNMGASSHHYIKTLEGRMDVKNGDYIIKGVKGEFYPCKPDIFEMTYEKAE